MVELDRLRAIADDLSKSEWCMGLSAALHKTLEDIEGGPRDLSGYESDVLAWVEKNGGLEAVKERTMPEDMSWPFYEDGEPVRLGEHWQQDGFDWSITSIDSIEFADDGVRFENEYNEVFYRYGERVKRPAPPVLDADGVEVRVGDTVYLLPGDWCDKFPCFGYYGGEELEVFSLHDDHVEGGIGCRDTRRPKGTCLPQASQLTHRAPVLAADGEPLEVGQTVWDANGDELVIGAIEDGGHTVSCRYADVGDAIPVHGMWSPSNLTHQRPVLDADGVPIHVGDTVYFTDGRRQECNTVVHVEYDYKDEPYVQLGRLNDVGYPTYTNCSCIDPSQLTHTNPEPPDSWGRIEREIERGKTYPGVCVLSIVRRCKALAERERSE